MLPLIKYIILGILVSIPFGPSKIALIRRGLRYGFKQSVLFSWGVGLADITLLMILSLGIVQLINATQIQSKILIFGSLVLIYIGYTSIRDFFRDTRLKTKDAKKRHSFFEGFTLTIVNPAAMAWWFLAFSSILLIALETTSAKITIIHGLAVILGIQIWFLIVSTLLYYGNKIINEKTLKYVSLCLGIILISIGLYFGYSGITETIIAPNQATNQIIIDLLGY